MKNTLKLSVLEFGSIAENIGPMQAIEDTLTLIREAENLGFYRYWLTEHHGGAPWNNPTILLPILGGYTEKIKIGSAGLLTYLYKPFQVAQDYKLLANLFPDRIDLGLTKGRVNENHLEDIYKISDPNSNFTTYNKNVSEIKELLQGKKDFHLPPFGGEVPNIWVLSKAKNSLELCVELNVNLSLSLFHDKDKIPSPEIIKNLLQLTKERKLPLPDFNIAVMVIYGKSDSEAKVIKESIPNTENFNIVSGSEERVRDELLKIQEMYQTSELVVYDPHWGLTERLRNMERLIKLV